MTLYTYVYQISQSDFLEATPIYDHPLKTHEIRVVTSDQNGRHYVFLPPVNLTELKTIVDILNLKLVRVSR